MHQILGAEPRYRLHVRALWVFVVFVLGLITYSCLLIKCCARSLSQRCNLYHTTACICLSDVYPPIVAGYMPCRLSFSFVNC